MKKSQAYGLGAGLALGLMCSGCRDLVLTNVVAGLQAGAITTTTGIIETLFGQHLSGASSTEGEGGGNDSFVQL